MSSGALVLFGVGSGHGRCCSPWQSGEEKGLKVGGRGALLFILACDNQPFGASI